MTRSLGWGSGIVQRGSDKVWVGTWLQLIVAPPQLYVSDCPSISEVRSEGWRWVRSPEVQSKFEEVRKEYQRCLSKVIFRLKKEDYVSCLLYYKVRSQ